VTVLTATAWKSNAELIEDVAKMGYLDGRVLDVTYGRGTFWKNWRPADLTACDLDPDKSPIGRSVDFTDLPLEWSRAFDAVVLDPPYKLNGRPNAAVDERYGVETRSSWQDRHRLVKDGIRSCASVTRRYLLLKCKDQVVGGGKRWQTFEFTNCAATYGLVLEDRFDMLVTPRPQPKGRRQVHTQSNYSTLLVFKRTT
jgi:hypothetical protein